MRAHIDSEGIVLEGQLPYLEANSSKFLCCHSGFDVVSDQDLISYKDILWVEPSESGLAGEIEVNYIRKFGDQYKPCTNCLNIGRDLEADVMAKAYEGSVPGRSILVLINPHSGKGEALDIYYKQVEPVLVAAHCKLEVKSTMYSGHAQDIAREIDISKYDMILCASGDGIPHEVINGLYQRDDHVEAFNRLIITQTPSGSGNAMSLSCLGTLEPTVATVELLKGQTVTCDLMAISYDDDPQVKLSFLSQTYGIIAQADIGTEWVRWIGQSRFILGVVHQVLARKRYPCDLYLKYIAKTDQEMVKFYEEHMNEPVSSKPVTADNFKLKFTNAEGFEKYDQNVCNNLSIFYSGKMPYISKDTNFFPAALPSDGSIDIVVSDVRSGILKAATALLSIDKGLHVWQEEISHFKVAAYRLVPHKSKAFVSVDGENFPVKPMLVQVLHGVVKTVMQGGSFKETGFYEHANNR